MRKLNEVELFAGAGGSVDGFAKTHKYNLLGAVEWLKPQVNTLIYRLENKYHDTHAADKVLRFDIRRTSELIHGWKNDPKFGSSKGLNNLINNKNVDIISGGPPCQAYSLAGRIRDKNGMRNDYRNFLFEAYIRVVNYYKPKLIFFENVEGILSAIPTGKKITELIRKDFNKIGYEIVDNLRKYALQDLTEYGVPQRRNRVIIIGIRRDSKKINYQKILKIFYTKILPKEKVKDKKTVKDAIGDLPPIYPLKHPSKRKVYNNTKKGDKNYINGHQARYQNPRDRSIFHELAKDILEHNHKYDSSKALIKLYYKKTGKHTNVHKYHVLRWNKPSDTIPAHLKKDGLRHIHPDPKQERSITVREAARLQTFDDDFKFIEPMTRNYEMIGNALPPLFAYKLGLVLPKIFKLLNNN